MEPENNTGTEQQVDRPSEHPSLEQQQLEDIYNGFKERLKIFFLECKKQIQESARARREAESTIRAQKGEIEELERKKSARELLDRLGYAFARLYRTVRAVPEEVCAKRELIACIQQLNREFENFGVHPIYELSCGAYQDRKCYEILVCQAEDESQVGTVQLEKMGFEIEGEEIIEAQCIEFKKDSNFRRDEELPKQEKTSVEQFSFLSNTDFRYIQNYSGGDWIQIISRKMWEAFDDMIDRRDEGYIQLNKIYYDELHLRKMIFRVPESKDRIWKFNLFCLTKENDKLYLRLGEAASRFGKTESKWKEKLPLAIIL